ncbi:CDP-alcohol phosphatidyltransferase family protein [Desulfosarcina sp. OttesenSCG-928-G10]|nr:CDP-alcohol phosphatidyltransferase family protein [Desulfosarcina sp. OttesenSCG-928-G10]
MNAAREPGFFTHGQGFQPTRNRGYVAISVYNLKPAFIGLLRPLAVTLAGAGVTANQVTVAACLLSVLYAGALFRSPDSVLLWGLLPVWLFVRMALNAIDGILAREFGQKSRLGALLNEMGDVVADAALFAPLALVPGVSVPAVFLFIWMALMTEFAGVLALLVDCPRRYDGPCGKSDRAFLIGLAGLLIAGAYVWGWSVTSVLSWGLYICSALMVWTTANRLRNALAGGVS